MKYSDFLAAARQPIPFQWRVQSRSKDKTKAICSAYIDARDVMNRLDEIGVKWDTSAEEVGGFIFCRLTIEGEDFLLNRTDVGMRPETDEKDQMFEQAGKSAYSDAFKRAAVQFGIGRFLYDLPMETLPCDQYGNVVDSEGKRVWDLTKHINDLRSKGTRPKAKAEQKTEAKAETTEKPALDQTKLDAMVQAIHDGKVEQVEKAMDKYTLSNAQRLVLNGLIKNKKNETRKDSNK